MGTTVSRHCAATQWLALIIFAISPGRQPMDVRHGELAHEGNPLLLDARPFHALPPERVGPVQHDEFQVVLARRLHAARHRGKVRVRAAADVLQIEHQRIQAAEHVGRRLARHAVERIRRQTRERVAPRGHVGAGQFGAVEPVLGGEQGGQVRRPARGAG